jgi:hypothetical protein
MTLPTHVVDKLKNPEFDIEEYIEKARENVERLKENILNARTVFEKTSVENELRYAVLKLMKLEEAR